MLIVVTPKNQSRHREALHEMYKLRYRALVKHDAWNGVEGRDGLEVDEFDGPETYYALSCNRSNGTIDACVRFSPSWYPTLSSTTFSDLFTPSGLPTGNDIFDVSRLVVDPGLRTNKQLSPITNEIGCAWVEFAMALKVRLLTAVVDYRYLQVALSRGMIMEPLGLPRDLGPHKVIGIQIPIDDRNLAAVREWRGLEDPVLTSEQVSDIQAARVADTTPRSSRGKGYARA